MKQKNDKKGRLCHTDTDITVLLLMLKPEIFMRI